MAKLSPGNPAGTQEPASSRPSTLVKNGRVDLTAEGLKRGFLDHLYFTMGKYPAVANQHDLYMALAYTVRDGMMERWISTVQNYRQKDIRVVCYLSAEFLLGRHLANNLGKLDILKEADQAMSELGFDTRALCEEEPEPGLGNGGLGRLAACFMDSLATLNIPAIGYGIRYEFGMFEQTIEDGWQVEKTDKWLELGNPWEIQSADCEMEVKFGGHTEGFYDQQNRFHVRWVPDYVVKGIPYDTPILGYRTGMANRLRLWKAQAAESFDFSRFNTGDYAGAVEYKVESETISRVLYPNDEKLKGKELRLEQQYFFVSCSLQDMIRIHKLRGRSLEDFDTQWAIQMNDTHPSIGVAELMRLFVDVYDMDWEPAWEITRKSFGYTNHTLLSEALERWPIPLFGKLLPRHLEIIYEINRRFLEKVRARYPRDEARVRRVSVIDECGERFVRMAHLAAVGSHAINGVSELHTQLLKEELFPDFYQMWPERFSNKTNGVTPRRWLLLSNPRLSALISEHIGSAWPVDLRELRKLESYAGDPEFLERWNTTRQEVKAELAGYILAKTKIEVDPASMFDIQVKRIHEYKRQHLNVLHILTLYRRLRQNPQMAVPPRTFIFGGKAAPSYKLAKLIIKLIHSVAEVVNNDPAIGGRIKVVFLPDYNVSVGQKIYPAADLSEQISTAGKEASGTGCMKFAMNGALTIGTLDGANVEIREEVGAENFFLFGLTADQVLDLKAKNYSPRRYYESDPELRQVLDDWISGEFSRGDTDLFRPLFDSLLDRDEYMLLADYRSYIDCQNDAGQVFLDQQKWNRMSITNVARIGKFSSDRAIREYCQDIWKTGPIDGASS
ncbi:MAG TPA: glycogen/starch/alpha-glucan phosphorylase [Acidobacteriaceae bacterium]|nr:glycogen/starch/alpha-glucan phosphorylase [Acidobacteriaceae bacterium]